MASLLVAYLFLQFIWTRVYGGSNQSISLGSSLVAGAHPASAWYSESRLFAFGFQPQGDGYVVAIWLPSFEENENNVVWSLYRDESPVSPNATLKLTHKGELVLFSGGVNKSIAANISYAVMNNSGNFVLYNDHMDIVWQSFDSPTDTILQGQSLLSGRELVSSVSKTNYSSGRFRIKMDGNPVMYPINMVDQIYWVSYTYFIEINTLKNYMYLDDKGLWNRIGNDSELILSLHTEPAYNVIYGATLGDYGVFRLYSYNHTNSTFSRSLVWKTPNQPCDVPSVCGCNSYCTTNDKYQAYCVCLPGSDFVDPAQNYNGCERNYTKVSCVNGNENMTYYNMVANEKLVLTDYSYYVSVGNEEYCKQSCLEDCFCDVAVLRENKCSKYKFPLRYVKKGDSDTISMSFFKIGTVSLNGTVNKLPQRENSSSNSWILILVIAIGFSVYSCISLSLSGFFIFKFRLLKYKRLLESRTLGMAEDLILRSYTYNELKKATNEFKEELGRGSFGTVYKGSFYKGKKMIAVKRLEKVVAEGEREFRAEMQVIGKTHHKNLVRLLGYCAEGKSERLLVYEYMGNGTLADRLFISKKLPDWRERVQIALDIARGILYLHEECESPIIHCDIKPQNILMDDFWTAKISDFGLAKLLKPDQTKTFTMVRGTKGYLAPEWHKNIPVSVKVDIFSYGIVLLEIICCRRNLDIQVSNPDEIVLANWAFKCFEKGRLDLLVDHEEVEKETLERLVKVGLWCIQDEPAIRPSMKCVLLMLEGITDIATPPCPTST